MIWSEATIEEKTAEIVRLFEKNHFLSAGDIGAMTGATRNAVLSHINRYKIEHPGALGTLEERRQRRSLKPPKPAPKPKPKPKPKHPFKVTFGPETLPAGSFPEVEEIFIPVKQRLRLEQLTEHTCKWPIGDPLTPEFYFCGGPSEDGKPYCATHWKRAHYPKAVA